MSRGWWIALGVVGAIGAGSAWFLLHEPEIEPVSVTTTRAQKARVERRVHGVGHIEPVTTVRVSSNISGDLLELSVAEGDQVKAGTTLAKIDRERVFARVRQAEASMRSAEAQVRLEEAQLKAAGAEAVRTRDLHKQELATDSELERAEADVSVISARLEGAKQRVLEAKAALDEAQAALEKTIILAPIDGTVIVLHKKQGERIRGSDLSEDVLLELAPLTAMEVEVELSEQDIVLVHVGQSAEVEVDALAAGGEGKLEGRVVEIANRAIIRDRGTERETTSFSVKVALNEVPSRVLSGMSASVSILTDAKDGVLAVPIEAVTARLPSALEMRAEEVAKREREKSGFFFGRKKEEPRQRSRRRAQAVKVVFVVDDGRAEPVRVETGISSDRIIEVVSGLQPNSEVIIGPYRALAKQLHPGTPVEVTDRVPMIPVGDGKREVAKTEGKEP